MSPPPPRPASAPGYEPSAKWKVALASCDAKRSEAIVAAAAAAASAITPPSSASASAKKKTDPKVIAAAQKKAADRKARAQLPPTPSPEQMWAYLQSLQTAHTQLFERHSQLVELYLKQSADLLDTKSALLALRTSVEQLDKKCMLIRVTGKGDVATSSDKDWGMNFFHSVSAYQGSQPKSLNLGKNKPNSSVAAAAASASASAESKQ